LDAFAGVMLFAAPLCEVCWAENRYRVQFTKLCASAGATAKPTNIAAAVATLAMNFTTLASSLGIAPATG
jgi:hypothetical protein